MKYTSFAIAVIESIWPNPDGYDYTGDSDETYGKDSRIMGQNATDVVGETFHEDGGGTNGWFKIAPLNITSMKTQATTGEGNKWSLTFTADDLILVSKKGLSANGILSDILDSVRESGDGTLSQESFRSALMNVPYASRRISLRDGFFNVQDLVIPGDTISIWYYCDPAEFYPIEDVENALRKTSDVSIDFHEIIGSGDRRVQFREKNDQYNSEYKLGLPSSIYAAALKSATSGKAATTAFTKQQIDEVAIGLVKQSRDQLVLEDTELAKAIPATEARSTPIAGRLDSGGFYADKLALYLQNFFPQEMGDYVKFLSKGANKALGVSSKYSNDYDTGVQYYSKALGSPGAAIHYYTMMLYSNPSLKGLSDSKVKGQKTSVDAQIAAFKKNYDKDKQQNSSRPEAFNWNMPFSPDLYIAGRNAMLNMVNSKVKTAAGDIKTSSLGAHTNTSRISRKLLTINNIGETPFLIMKGHVQGISAALSATVRTITLTGSGMEYPLEKHTIFYDTSSQSLALNGFLQTYLSNAMYTMNAAEQMLFILNKNAPKQIRWGKMSSRESTALSIAKMNSNLAGIIENDETLTAGTMIFVPRLKFDKNGKYDDKTKLYDLTRVFTPLTHYSTYRLGEALKSFALADPTGMLGNTASPAHIEDRVSVMQAIKQVAGAQNLMEFFVDANGYMIYRVAAEAWERTPKPEYTPTIEEPAVISANFSESDENIGTTIDVTMAQNSAFMNNTGVEVTRFLFGRGVPRVAKLPIKVSPPYTRMNELESVLAPDMFRYGLRYQVITDVYGGTSDAAMDKANTIYRFYGSPIKRAEITVVGNPSYRAGDTVLLFLPSMKKRVKKRLKLSRVKDWLNALDENRLVQYVGNDERANPKYIGQHLNGKAQPNYYNNPEFGPSDVSYMDKHTVRKHMVATITEMEKHIDSETPITWDYFPTTLWYYLGKKDKESGEIVRAYGDALKAATSTGVTLNAEQVKNIKKHLPKLRFNNFMCMSYYIDSVAHAYEYNTTSQTDLTLSYGQENICLISPDTGLPVGFFSVDRKIRDLFPDPVEFQEIKDGPDGVWRKLIYQQFLQDKQFRESSFVYQAAAVRNTSNYLHQIAESLGKT